MEEALNRQINNMESSHPGYDEYNYQIDEIGHNPYHLISYLTAKYGVWTIDDVRDELQTYLKGFRVALKAEEENEMVKSIRSMKLNSHELFDLLNGIQDGTIVFQAEESDSEEGSGSFLHLEKEDTEDRKESDYGEMEIDD